MSGRASTSAALFFPRQSVFRSDQTCVWADVSAATSPRQHLCAAAHGPLKLRPRESEFHQTEKTGAACSALSVTAARPPQHSLRARRARAPKPNMPGAKRAGQCGRKSYCSLKRLTIARAISQSLFQIKNEQLFAAPAQIPVTRHPRQQPCRVRRRPAARLDRRSSGDRCRAHARPGTAPPPGGRNRAACTGNPTPR